MFRNYLITALRSIRNHWVYTILSICCLAIGTAMFSALFYGINYDDFFKNRLPGHKHSCFVYMEAPENLNSEFRPQAYRSQLPYSEYYNTLREMPQVEMVSVSGSITEGFSFTDQDKVYCKGKMEGMYVEGDFFRYWNLSLLYGDRKPENKNEIIVSEALLKRMGYDKDISQLIALSESMNSDSLQVVNVVRDDRWSRSLGADVFFSASRMPITLPLYDVDVVLKEGVSLDDVNSRIRTCELKSFSRSGVMQLTRLDVNPDGRVKGLLLSLLSIIVLVVAVTNFLKHMIMVLKQRNRSNAILYSLGAKQRGLTMMLMVQILIILICSYAAACYISFCVCTWLNQAVYMGDRYFHAPDMFRLNTYAVLGVGLICAAVCRFAVLGQNRAMRNRLVINKSESKTLKYIVIGIESAVAVFALASVFVIALTAPRPYNPLTKSQTRRTFFVETEEGHSATDAQQGYYNKISQLPQVEDIIPSGTDWNGVENYEYLVGNGDRYMEEYFFVKDCDIRYFQFFNIPIEWLDPTQPSSGYLLDRHTYDRYVMNNVDFNSLGLMWGSDKRPIQITGVFDQLMCGNPQIINGNGEITIGFRYDTSPLINHRSKNFFVRFRTGVSRSEAEELIRKTWKETNPSSIEEPKIRPVPKYTDDDMRFTALGFQVGGIVCILLVILSVTSSISAETNIRRKEVALRKINGAKQKNIIALFIKPYCIILAVAFPIGILASMALIGKTMEIDGYLKSYIWIAPLTLVATALMIALSIFSKIRTIMRTDPAIVIKSE